jgi:hypothetical protein
MLLVYKSFCLGEREIEIVFLYLYESASFCG